MATTPVLFFIGPSITRYAFMANTTLLLSRVPLEGEAAQGRRRRLLHLGARRERHVTPVCSEKDA